MRAADHPMYSDANLTRFLSQWHLQHGKSVLQLFQLGASERAHSEELLRLVRPPMLGQVLSLGCGVGGVERYWKLKRHDLNFTLLNLSQEQLNLCVCEGRHVCENLENFRSADTLFDVVLMGYVLGHVDLHKAMLSAMENCKVGGRIVVLDVFDVSAHFSNVMHYNPPLLSELEWWAASKLLRFRRVVEGGPELQLIDYVKESHPWVEHECTPALFVLEPTQ